MTSGIKIEGRTIMKAKLRATIRKLFTVGLSCLMMFNTMVPTMQAFGADATKGIETKVDRTELDKSVQSAKDAGVPVNKTQDIDKGIAKSKAEVDAKISEIKTDYQQQIKELEEAKKAIAKCKEEKKAYEIAKKKYDEELAKYNIAKKKYDEEMVKYNKAMEELEKKKKTDGYMEEPNPQTLLFKAEPNAKPSVNTKIYSSTDWLNEVVRMGYPVGSEIYNIALKYDRYSNDEGAFRIFLEKNKTVTAYYSNLQNSYFEGKKITRVEYKYTLRTLTASGKTKIPAILYYDPTVTINYSDLGANAEIEMEVTYYGEDGQPIDVTGALISFASLNRDYDNGVDRSEYVRDFNGQYIQIHGSSIRDNGNGVAISSTRSNEHVKNGSRFEVVAWDTSNSPNKWYGAIVGKTVGKTIKVTFGSRNRKAIWFAFNSDIKAIGVPVKPVEPVKPTPPEEPQCPNIQASYHYDVLFYQPSVEKKVNDQNDADIDNHAVLKDSIVKFVLNVASLPAGHEKIDSLVFTDKLPEGYKLDLAGTKQASPNYDVAYDKDANEIKFSAKSDYLNTINADLNAEVNISAPVITGTVTKEGTTYKNDFKLTINNEYSVKSKPVKVHTPTEPKKEVFKGGTTTKIDGKVVQPEEELTYEITYKNTTGKDVNATITDKIPAHTKFVSAENGGTESGGTVTWNVAVPKGESKTVKFTVKVDKDVNGAPIDNVAKVNDGTNEYKTNETHNPTPTEPKKEVFKGGTTTKINGKVVQPEEELTYEITYKNTTGKDVNATITDKIPAHTKFVSAENGGTESGGTVTWNVAVPKGESKTVKFTVKVDKDVNGTPIDNVARVNDGTNEYKTNETHNPTPTEPKKDVFKGSDTTSINGKLVKAGQELRYEITYKNTTGTKQTVTITDKIPKYTTFVSADNSGAESNGTITWVKEVENGKSLTVSFRVKVNDDVNGNPVDNISHVKDGVNESDTNETHNPTGTEPKKEVFKGGTTTNIDGKRVEPEQELTYAITYKNTTGKDVNATITDKIPAHTKFVSAENGGTESGGTVTWNVAVPKGESKTVKFTVKVDKDVNGAPIDNVAKVNDGTNEYKTNETHNPTPTEPKKEVFKGGTTTNIDGKRVEPEQELTYAITYKNTTGKDVNATITDKIPAHTTFVSAENGGTESGGVVTWTANVEKGKSVTVKFTVKVDKDVNGKPIDNVAKVNDGVNEYKTNETHNPTPTEPKKEVFKGGTTTNIDGKRVEPEQELTYAITYKNTTGKDVNATITDKIPAHTKFVSADNGGTESGGTVKWNVAVAKDQSVKVKFTVKVDNDVNGAPIDNVAKVNDGTNEYKTNETHNPTPTEPKKEVFKGGTTTNIDGKPVKGGEELTYEITYKNTTGKDVNATITDKIPAHTKFVSADNGGTESGGTVKWNVAVAKDQSVKVKFTVKVDNDVNGAPIDNVAKVNDGTNEYKTNETHNPTPTKPKKEVFKYGTTTNIDGKKVEPGQKLTYAITYKNTTGSERDVTITDNIPTYTTFVSADNDGVFADGKVTWTKKVAAGKTYKVTFTVQVNKDAYEVMVINKATVRDGFNDSDTNVVKNPTPKKTVPGIRKPKTGDDNNIIPFAILLLASLGGLGGTVTIRRKRH